VHRRLLNENEIQFHLEAYGFGRAAIVTGITFPCDSNLRVDQKMVKTHAGH
jgi:hypothetical protein